MNIQEHVKSGKSYGDDSARHAHVRTPAPRVECKDGFSVSIQANQWAYCEPQDNEGPYTSFELGFPSAGDDLIMEYMDGSELSPTQNVYGRVPLAVVEALLEKHGGVK